MVTDQSRTIFSHYFLAKPSFWKQYFKYAEQIFEIAPGHSSMARSLNEPVSYKNRQTKNIALEVFVDALKTTYVKTKNPYYLRMYEGFGRALLNHQKY